MSTTAIFGSYVLTRKDGVQDVLRDHWYAGRGQAHRGRDARSAGGGRGVSIVRAASCCRAC